MTSTQPWDVRHIYTTADPMYDNVSSWSYLTILTKSLREHARAGRVRFLRGCGVSASPDIGPARWPAAGAGAVQRRGRAVRRPSPGGWVMTVPVSLRRAVSRIRRRAYRMAQRYPLPSRIWQVKLATTAPP